MFSEYDVLERDELIAQLAEAKAEVTRAKVMAREAERRVKFLEGTTVHYMQAWIMERDRVTSLRGALGAAAESLEKEGLTRSAEAAREACRGRA